MADENKPVEGNTEADESVLNPTEGDNAPGTDGAPLDPTEAKETPDAPAEGKQGAGEGEGEHVLDPDEKDDKEVNDLNGAPESYDKFTLPEGYSFPDEESEREASELFKSLNLSQKGGQKLIDAHAKYLNRFKAAQLEAWAEAQKKGREEIKSRPTYAADRVYAQKGLRALVQTDEEKAMFKGTWLADHPVFFGMFVKVGKMLAEDSPLPAAPSDHKSDGTSPVDRFPVK